MLINGIVTVGTTATPICTLRDPTGAVFQVTAGGPVFVGGPNVTTGSAMSFASGTAPVTMPAGRGDRYEVTGAAADSDVLYGIVAAGTGTVAFLAAGGP